MKATTKAMIAEAREMKAVGYDLPMRRMFATFYRRNRTSYPETRLYARARGEYLVEISYPDRAQV